MFRKILSLVSLLVLGAGLIVFAQASKSPPKQSNQATPPLEKIKVIYPTNAPVIALFVAQDKGFFEKNGLSVEIIPVERGALEMMISGQVDFNIATPFAFLNASAEGADFKQLAIIGRSFSYNILSLKPKNQIRKVGVVKIGSIGYMMDIIGLYEIGLKSSQLEFVPLDSAQARITNLKLGKIDAAGFGILDTLSAEKELGKKVEKVFSAQESNFGFPVGVNVSQKTLSQKTEAAEKLLKALIEATFYAQNNKPEAINILKKNSEVNPEQAEVIYDSFQRGAQKLDFRPKTETLKFFLEALKADFPKLANLNPESFVESSYIDKISQSGFIEELKKGGE